MSRTKAVQMSAAQSSVAARDFSSQARALVREMVTMLTRRGLKVPHAMQIASDGSGITARRVRALYKDELTRICAEQYKGLLDRYIRHLDDEASDLIARTEALVAKRASLERAATSCPDGFSQSAPGGHSDNGAALSSAMSDIRAKRLAYEAARAKLSAAS